MSDDAQISVRRAAETELERYARLLDEARRIRGVSLGRDAWRRLRKNYAAMAALAFLVLITMISILTPLLPVAPPRAEEVKNQYIPPIVNPLFVEQFHLPDEAEARERFVRNGFGDLGPFARLLIGSPHALVRRVAAQQHLRYRHPRPRRVFTIAVGLARVARRGTGGHAGVAGHWRHLRRRGRLSRRADRQRMMRLVDVLYSVPFIFVVIFIISVVDNPIWRDWLDRHGIDRIFVFFILVGAIYWLTMSRVVRGQVISLKQNQFIEAARTIGAGRARIVFRHLLPNVLSVVIVYLTLTIPNVMLFEAFLSFLGLGVARPDVSWGLMANEGMQVITPIKIYWWLVVFPSLALGLTLFSLNVFGDGLRDALDPRLKNR